MSVSIHLLTQFPPIGFSAMRAEAEAEEEPQLEALSAAWQDRTQRFQLDGEALFAALLHDRLAGLGALAQDPALPPEEVLRVQRLYVRPDCRRHGVGRALLRRLVQHGLRHAPTLIVDAPQPAAHAFFDACGFTALDDPGVTHRLLRDEDRE